MNSPYVFPQVRAYSELQGTVHHQRIQEMLNKLVVIKLSGGLGTSMGCTGIQYNNSF